MMVIVYVNGNALAACHRFSSQVRGGGIDSTVEYFTPRQDFLEYFLWEVVFTTKKGTPKDACQTTNVY